MTKTEFIKWLREQVGQCAYNLTMFRVMDSVLEKAYSLADTKDEGQSRPLADKGLVEELETWIKGLDTNSVAAYDIAVILSRFKSQESLEELADRKNCGVYLDYGIYPKTYADGPPAQCGTELEARQYLEGLPDRKEGEK